VRREEGRDLFTEQSLSGAHLAQSARREDDGTSPLLRAGWRAGTVDEWVNGINAFLRAEMTDYRHLMPQYLQSLSECASTSTAGHVDSSDARSSAASAAAARHMPAPAAVGAGRAEEADVAASSSDAAGSIWEAVGGYEHPQPGSRLLQYGECASCYTCFAINLVANNLFLQFLQLCFYLISWGNCCFGLL
jgi:hypothetical protein